MCVCEGVGEMGGRRERGDRGGGREEGKNVNWKRDIKQRE